MMDEFEHALGNYGAMVRPMFCNCGALPRRHCQISPYLLSYLRDGTVRAKCVTLEGLRGLVNAAELSHRPGQDLSELYAIFFARQPPPTRR